MSKILILLIILILIGCGPKPIKKASDPTFDDYKHRWFDDTGVDAYWVPINFGKLEGNTVGQCIMYNKKEYNKITIDPDAWEAYDDTDRELLIYHELGHCALEISGHDNGVLYNGCPASIMNEYMMTIWEVENCYIPDKPHYIADLLK